MSNPTVDSKGTFHIHSGAFLYLNPCYRSNGQRHELVGNWESEIIYIKCRYAKANPIQCIGILEYS